MGPINSVLTQQISSTGSRMSVEPNSSTKPQQPCSADSMSSRSLSLTLVNDRKEIPRLGEFAQRFGEAQNLTEDDRFNIQLVLDEIVINVILHGYEEAGDTDRHEIHVRLSLDEERLLTIQVEDDARAYDPREAPEPQFNLPIEERRLGGLGVHIVKAIM